MPFKHKPQAEEDDLLKDGKYEAVVRKAIEGRSKKGNSMLTLLLEVYAGQRRASVYDYLVDVETMAWKTRHFCESAGLDYEAGELELNEVEGCRVFVDLTVEPAQNGFKAKNKVADYLPKDVGHLSPPAGTADQMEFVATDDDVPF